MTRFQARAINQLDFSAALQAEAAAPNSVLPPQPGLAKLAENQRERFARWLGKELQAGRSVAPRVVVNARKPRLGTRPAPILAIPERVAYRAIVDHLLADEPPLPRSQEDYLRFVRGPVDYLMQKHGLRLLRRLEDDDEIQYVVQSDLASFYEYIDHGVLGRLLVARARSVEFVEQLVEFLADLEGRGYGLPQMFVASDRLSELYGQLIQDQLARRGYLVWRFNDDFRIGVHAFEVALHAIEALSEEARSLGLIINEQKTFTPKFVNYAMTAFDLDSVDDEIPTGEEDEVESAVADYTDMFGDPAEAVALLSEAVAEQGEWDLKKISQHEASRLRRSIWSVVRAKDERALAALVPLAIYVPHLTPVLCRYAEALADEHQEEVAAAVDEVLEHASLGGWQRLWVNRLLGNARLLFQESPGNKEARLSFARKCAQDARHAATRAEAVLALAPLGEVPVAAIAESLVTEPRALSSWYVVAAAEASGGADDKVLGGIRGSDPFFAMLLDAVS